MGAKGLQMSERLFWSSLIDVGADPIQRIAIGAASDDAVRHVRTNPEVGKKQASLGGAPIMKASCPSVRL